MNRTLMMVGVLAIFALALLIVACGPDDAPTPPVGPTAPPMPTTPAEAPTAAPTAVPTAEPTAPPTPRPATPAPTDQPTPAPTAPPTAAAPTPAPTPEEPEEADPSDAYFAMDRVLEVSIEISEEDWDTLRHQTRTFEDLMAEIEKYNLSQPFADIYTWFSATVTIDGETHTEVGVRKKGFLGSQSDTKPSLKLRYDKYVDDQALGGVIERMTLNNSVQDPSMVNTCLAYQVFAAAGLPSSRCSFATVSVNGKDLGLYVHVEEIKKPFLARHFDSTVGNLYEGTISDFTPEYRGTLEKKTNEDENDWSDVDAVAAALQDPSDAGLEALGELVDLERFLSFWATESLVGHWDGYTGDRNNYHFYREPGRLFVFIPWGVDDTFHLKDDPNAFDNISNPPPSVLALTAIPNRLYNIPEWRAKYAERMKEILDTAWDEDALLASVDEMAAIVQEHALPADRAKAAEDTERVRKFILKRKGEILADLTPEPPDWPEPYGAAAADGVESFELRFETTWGSNWSVDPLAEGTVYELDEEGEWVAANRGEAGATAGPASPQEEGDIGVKDAGIFTVMGLYSDGAIRGVTFWIPVDRVAAGAELFIGVDADVGGVIWTIPAEGVKPEGFIPVTAGSIELAEAGTEPGAAIAGRIHASFEDAPQPSHRDQMETDSATEESFTVELHFETAWGSKDNLNPAQVGMVTYLVVDGYEEEITEEDLAYIGIIAGDASPEEAGILPGIAEPVSITYIVFEDDGSLEGATFVLSKKRLTSGAVLNVVNGELGGGHWTIPDRASTPDGFLPDMRGRVPVGARASTPDGFLPLTTGWLEIIEADTTPGAPISIRFSGRFGDAPLPTTVPEPMAETADIGLVINEVAAKGDPLDWFELYNALPDPIGLFAFLVADDLTDASKRAAFPPGTEIQPGEYLQFEVDSDNWAGFKLGGDEELGIWLADGTLVAMVDWDKGDSGEGESYARIPDASGEFQTVGNPTPGATNQP